MKKNKNNINLAKRQTRHTQTSQNNIVENCGKTAEGKLPILAALCLFTATIILCLVGSIAFV